MSIKTDQKEKELGFFSKLIAYFFSALGAIGSALQNYIAVEVFIRAIAMGFTTIGTSLSAWISAIAIGLGGICSGMINFFINIDLLESFLKRITGKIKQPKLTFWQKIRYFAGSFVFVITGILFGMTAFTIGMASPLLLLAIIAGVLVALIMVIQELETWLQSFDDPKKQTLREIFIEWKSSLNTGKIIGHVIAAGNVIALSLLFAFGLTEVLILLNVAAIPAFIIGMVISFTFGAFTEFYFYNAFLAQFCQYFSKKWQDMVDSKFSVAGFILVGINSLVNAALTYAGVQLLFSLVISAGIGVPPLGLIIAIATISALFAAAASSILGLDFWIRKMRKVSAEISEASDMAVNNESLGNLDDADPAKSVKFLFEQPLAVLNPGTVSNEFFPVAVTATASPFSQANPDQEYDVGDSPKLI